MYFYFYFFLILGSANIRIGLAQQDAPFSIPHCIARRTTGANESPRRNVQDQVHFCICLNLIYYQHNLLDFHNSEENYVKFKLSVMSDDIRLTRNCNTQTEFV